MLYITRQLGIFPALAHVFSRTPKPKQSASKQTSSAQSAGQRRNEMDDAFIAHVMAHLPGAESLYKSIQHETEKRVANNGCVADGVLDPEYRLGVGYDSHGGYDGHDSHGGYDSYDSHDDYDGYYMEPRHGDIYAVNADSAGIDVDYPQQAPAGAYAPQSGIWAQVARNPSMKSCISRGSSVSSAHWQR